MWPRDWSSDVCSSDLQVLGQRAGPMVVEAHPVDQGPVAEQAEGARSRVARLGVGGDGADLDMTEAQVQQSHRDLAVLVVAGGNAQRAEMLNDLHPLRRTPDKVCTGVIHTPAHTHHTSCDIL